MGWFRLRPCARATLKAKARPINDNSMITLYDVHTHNPPCGHDSGYNIKYILNTVPNELEVIQSHEGNRYLSCGIHPWCSSEWMQQFDILNSMSTDESIVAIGECGLDRLRDLPMNIQIDIFRKQIVLSEQVNKPLIIHCVKSWDKLLSIKKEMKPRQTWIVHGFRGKPALAKQLVETGIYLSIGALFNKQSVLEIPLDKLFLETDQANVSIEAVYRDVALALNLCVSDLAVQVNSNVKDVFCIT